MSPVLPKREDAPADGQHIKHAAMATAFTNDTPSVSLLYHSYPCIFVAKIKSLLKKTPEGLNGIDNVAPTVVVPNL